MNGCYSLFSVAVMTAACASASRQLPPKSEDKAVSTGPRVESNRARDGHARTESALVADDPDERTMRELREAKSLFESFITKAGDDPKYADAVLRSRERIDDIQVELDFIGQGLAERRRQRGE